MAKMKQHIWAMTAAVISIYFSFVFAVGIILGYLGTKAFIWKFWKTGRIKSIRFSFAGREARLHHWAIGGLILAAIGIFGSFHGCPQFILGGIGGIIVEDFKDVYQPLLGWIKSKALKKG